MTSSPAESGSKPETAASDAPAAEIAPRAQSWPRRIIRWCRDLVGMVLVVLVLSHLIGSWRAPDFEGSAPDFTVSTLDGTPVTLSSLRGKRVVLNFWATWCMPCRLEAPAFSRWAARNPDAVVLGIAADGTPGELRAAASDLGITYSVARGPRALFERYGVTTYPTTVVIGPDGGVVASHTGLLTDPQLAWLARER